jgi:hypothetical protein
MGQDSTASPRSTLTTCDEPSMKAPLLPKLQEPDEGCQDLTMHRPHLTPQDISVESTPSTGAVMGYPGRLSARKRQGQSAESGAEIPMPCPSLNLAPLQGLPACGYSLPPTPCTMSPAGPANALSKPQTLPHNATHPRPRSALTASFWSTVIGEQRWEEQKPMQIRHPVLESPVICRDPSVTHLGLSGTPSNIPLSYSPARHNKERPPAVHTPDQRAAAYSVARSSSLISDDRSGGSGAADRILVPQPASPPARFSGSQAMHGTPSPPQAGCPRSCPTTLPSLGPDSAFTAFASHPATQSPVSESPTRPLPTLGRLLPGQAGDRMQADVEVGSAGTHLKSFAAVASSLVSSWAAHSESGARPSLARVGRDTSAEASVTARKNSRIPHAHAQLLLAGLPTSSAPFVSPHSQAVDINLPVLKPLSSVNMRQHPLTCRPGPSSNVYSSVTRYPLASPGCRDDMVAVNPHTEEIFMGGLSYDQSQRSPQDSSHALHGEHEIHPLQSEYLYAVSARRSQGNEILDGNIHRGHRESPSSKRPYAELHDGPSPKRARVSTPSESKRFSCDVCGRRFDRRGHLISHIEAVHNRQKLHPCSMCDARFGHSSSLLRHRRTLHEQQPVKAGRVVQGLGQGSSTPPSRQSLPGARAGERGMCMYQFGQEDSTFPPSPTGGSSNLGCATRFGSNEPSAP